MFWKKKKLVLDGANSVVNVTFGVDLFRLNQLLDLNNPDGPNLDEVKRLHEAYKAPNAEKAEFTSVHQASVIPHGIGFHVYHMNQSHFTGFSNRLECSIELSEFFVGEVHKDHPCYNRDIILEVRFVNRHMQLAICHDEYDDLGNHDGILIGTIEIPCDNLDSLMMRGLTKDAKPFESMFLEVSKIQTPWIYDEDGNVTEYHEVSKKLDSSFCEYYNELFSVKLEAPQGSFVKANIRNKNHPKHQ